MKSFILEKKVKLHQSLLITTQKTISKDKNMKHKSVIYINKESARIMCNYN